MRIIRNSILGISICLTAIIAVYLLFILFNRPSYTTPSSSEFDAERQKIETTLQLAITEKDFQVCESLPMVFGNENFDLEKGLQRIYPRADCYTSYASQTSDESICLLVSDSFKPSKFMFRGLGLIYYGSAYYSTMKIQSSLKTRACYESVAVENNRPEVCVLVRESVTHSTSVGSVNDLTGSYQECLNAVAVQAEDPLLCGPEYSYLQYNRDTNDVETIKTRSRGNCVIAATSHRAQTAIELNDVSQCDSLPEIVDYEDQDEVVNYTARAICVDQYINGSAH